MKIDKKKFLPFFIMVMLIMTFVTSAVMAQTGSLAVWENVADGTLICDWDETADDVWTADNYSGLWLYNCTGKAYNVSINSTTIGQRWMQTFEVLTSDPTHGISAIQTLDTTLPTTRFYAMEYYISHAGVSPKAYIVYHQDGTNYYWNTTAKDWDANVSNATDYSGQQEIDFYSGETFARVKAQWNWGDYDTGDDLNCTARFKIWLTDGDEPRTWMIDDAFSMYSGTSDQSWYAGIGANHTHTADGVTEFRRIFFWNLSYDYDEECHTVDEKIPYIGVPQVDAETMLTAIASWSGTDFYNHTVAFRDAINEWDVTSFYNESYDASKDGSQNDTVYIFSLLTTGWDDFFEEYFDDFWDGYDEYFPNNILVVIAFNTLDGTIDGDDTAMDWDDICRLRFDFDGDGYDATDYTFWVDGTEQLYGYRGWTHVIPDSPDYWYGSGNIDDTIDDASWGRIFRDYDYPSYQFFLNWDLISGETDAGECVNISIGFYDNETTDAMCFWQDWNLTNDTTPNTPATDNKTWMEEAWNTTTNWGILRIEGGALDFEDPDNPNDDDSPNYSETTENLLDNVIPILVAVVAVLMIIGLLFTQGVTTETLMATLVLVILLIVTLQIALGV